MFAAITGLPGTVYDGTCLKRSGIWQFCSMPGPNLLFESGQYLLGDSAYTAQPHVVGAYKRWDVSQEREDFNICVAKCRVTNEHCIGVLKSRWHSLREIRVQLNEDKDHVWIVKWITVCAKLHNFVLSQNDPWSEDDVADQLPLQEDEVPSDAPPPGPRDSSRRTTTAISTALLREVVATAISHHRGIGTFASMGRQ